jgi:DNA-binding NarL/FixJ family response regulator
MVETHGWFDLFVIDLMMPQMRGDELARQLHRRDRQARALYFTGFSDHLFEERAALADHEAFVEKPASINGLLEAVSLMLGGHPHGPGTALRHKRDSPNETLIRRSYACFNDRRVDEAAALLATDAVVDMPPFVSSVQGRDAYVRFANGWLHAFPDGRLSPAR